jgi:hypothetical protein
MVKKTVGIGILLILLGLLGFILTGGQSVTAFIPAFFGILITLTGTLARKEKWHKHAMHAAVFISLLGFLGSANGLSKVIQMLLGQEIARTSAAIAQSIMAILCALLIIWGIKSFIAARRSK